MSATNTRSVVTRLTESRSDHWTRQAEIAYAAITAGMSQKDVGRHMNVSQGHVSKLVSTLSIPERLLGHALDMNDQGKPRYAREVFFALIRAPVIALVQVSELMERGEVLKTEQVRAMVGWKTRSKLVLTGDPTIDTTICLGVVRSHLVRALSGEPGGVGKEGLGALMGVDQHMLGALIAPLFDLGVVEFTNDRWRLV